MRNFNAVDYIKLIEHSGIKELNDYMDAEKIVVEQIPSKHNKSIIDLGAGHVRLLPFLSKQFRSSFSNKINPKMLLELKKRGDKCKNAIVIKGDITNFNHLLNNYSIENPVIALFQNTLGTIEGDWQKVLKQIKIFENANMATSVFISFFRAKAMGEWGKKYYSNI